MAFSSSLAIRQSGFTSGQWNQITQAINKLASSSIISSFFSNIASFDVAPYVPPQNTSPINAVWLEPDNTLVIGAVYGGITATGLSGPTDISFDRIIFHELVHNKYNDLSTSDWHESFSYEERAVFMENAIYVQAFGGSERVGHSSAGATGSAFAVSYLSGLNFSETSSTNRKFVFQTGDETVTKQYFDYGTTITAVGTYNYDHYIRVTIEHDVPLISSDGSVLYSRLSTALDSAMGGQYATRLSRVAGAYISHGLLVAELNQAGRDLPSGMIYYSFTQERAIFISAERFSDSRTVPTTISKDYYGAAIAGSQAAAGALAINGSGSSTDTVVFGASGYVSHGADTTVSWDDLMGGTGNDILLSGTGLAGHSNSLAGGTGNDTLFGGLADDTLSGGNGSDLLIGAGGADTLIGGGGFDVVSYAHLTHRVNINLALRASASDSSVAVGLGSGEAAGDKMASIEAIIGTHYNDTLKGDGSAIFLFGENGNDNLTGGTFDTLIGGRGNDTLTFTPGSSGGDGTLLGGAGDDVIAIEQSGRAYVDGGVGNDTITVTSGSYH